MRNSPQSLIDLTPDGVLIIDEKGFIIQVNSIATNFFSNCNINTTALHINTITGVDDQGSEPIYTMSLQKQFVNENGELRDLDILIKRREDGYVAFVRDVTEQTQYKQKLKEIIHMQSHDVRAPLTNIIGLISLVDLDKQSKHVNASILAHLKTSAHKLDAIIRRIVHSAINIHPVKQTRSLIFFRCYIPLCKFFSFLRKSVTG